jgi:hypothetical protein
MVRTADVKRGWGKYFEKSCKAKVQAKKQGGRPKISKSKRYQYLVEAHEDGQISDDYFYMTLENEYSEFKTSDDEWMCYIHNEMHPFLSEGLGQDV